MAGNIGAIGASQLERGATPPPLPLQIAERSRAPPSIFFYATNAILFTQYFKTI